MSGQIIFILHRQAIMKAKRACLVAVRKMCRREGREFGASSPFIQDFPGGSDGKASDYNAGDPGSMPRWEDLLEKEMATHSSIFAWKIPWTEKPSRLQCTASQRVGHN